MDALDLSAIFLFEDFRLDRRGLFRRDRAGGFVPVKIGSRALDLLRALIERPGELIARDELLAAVWPGTVVDSSNLAVQVATLREILDNREAGISCIRTVAGRGYCFIAQVSRHLAEHPLSRTAVRQSGARSLARLSIIVLPFTNLGRDPEQQYFADAITDDLTTDLSRVSGMFVISRSTAFALRGRPIDTREIGREFGVRYVLEGSVRPLQDRIRINVQLIDAESGAHLWAERFEPKLGDVPALQDEVTRQISIALNLELVAAEASRPAAHPQATDYIFRARAITMMARSSESHAQAISFYERALALDPESTEARLRLATQLIGRVLDDMTDTPTDDIERTEHLVGEVLPKVSRSELAHLVNAQLLRFRLRYKDAILGYESVLALNRNHAHALTHLAICKFMTGSEDETIPLIERAIRLSPLDPMIGNWYYRIGLVYLYQSRTHEATDWLEKACSKNSMDVLAHWTLAAAYGYSGDRDRAPAALAEARKLDTNNRHATIERVRANWVAIKPDTRFESIFLAGLRNAGLPVK